jgi:hypothetical protein
LHALIEKTKLGELKRMCLFLIALHDALWELYWNGRKPVVVPAEHSMPELLSPDHHCNSAPEIIVGQVREFFADDLSE